MDTTMEVDVDEDCTRTVAKTPIIKSAMGFDKILLLVNAFPAALPASLIINNLDNIQKSVLSILLHLIIFIRADNITLPPNNLNAVLRKSKAQTKIYSSPKRKMIRNISVNTVVIFSKQFFSENKNNANDVCLVSKTLSFSYLITMRCP